MAISSYDYSDDVDVLESEIESEVRARLSEQDLPPPRYKAVDPKLIQSSSTAAVTAVKSGFNNPEQRPYSTGSNLTNNPNNNTQNRTLRSKLLGSLLTHSLTHLLTYLLTHLITHSLTYLLTHLLTHSLTHSLTYSLTLLTLLTHSPI